jgi:hypothetical protein
MEERALDAQNWGPCYIGATIGMLSGNENIRKHIILDKIEAKHPSVLSGSGTEIYLSLLVHVYRLYVSMSGRN